MIKVGDSGASSEKNAAMSSSRVTKGSSSQGMLKVQNSSHEEVKMTGEDGREEVALLNTQTPSQNQVLKTNSGHMPKIDAEIVSTPSKVVENSSVNASGVKSKLLQRIRKIKHIEIYAAVVVILIMVAIYASNFLGGVSSTNDPQRQANENYAREMEARLVATLSQMHGVGRVEAMVTVVGSPVLEIAYNIEERTVTQTAPNGSVNTTTTQVRVPILVNGQPLILKTIKPQVRGVVIVAQGANDLTVRFAMIRAVQALIPDNTVRIEILAGR